MFPFRRSLLLWECITHSAHSAPSYHHPCAWWSFWRSKFYWNQTCFRRIQTSMNYHSTITRITNLSSKLQVHVSIVWVEETIKVYAMNLTQIWNWLKIFFPLQIEAGQIFYPCIWFKDRSLNYFLVGHQRIAITLKLFYRREIFGIVLNWIQACQHHNHTSF